MSGLRAEGSRQRVHRRPGNTGAGALARVAATGIYVVSGIPRDLQRAARVRAESEGTTLRAVLLKALAEYAGHGTPQPEGESRESAS